MLRQKKIARSSGDGSRMTATSGGLRSAMLSKINGLSQTSISSGQPHQMVSASSIKRAGAVMIAMNSGKLSGSSATAKRTIHIIGPPNAKSRGSLERHGKFGMAKMSRF